MPEIIKRTYETFGNAAKTKALKVLIEAQARLRGGDGHTKETASARGYMLRPSIHRTLGADASGSASTSYLDGDRSGSGQRKPVGYSIREISMTEQ